LHMFLDDTPGVTVVGISDRLKGLLSQLKGSEPDVLLLDWVSPLQSIADLFGNLCNLEHRPKTIVFSTRAEDAEAIIAAGADYFISKDAPPDELIPILNDLRLATNQNDVKEKRL
jgi:DNA-binding NarL/FixJ family response regulator